MAVNDIMNSMVSCFVEIFILRKRKIRNIFRQNIKYGFKLCNKFISNLLTNSNHNIIYSILDIMNYKLSSTINRIIIICNRKVNLFQKE